MSRGTSARSRIGIFIISDESCIKKDIQSDLPRSMGSGHLIYTSPCFYYPSLCLYYPSLWDASRAFEVGHFEYTSQTFWKWEASVGEVQIKGTLVEV